MTLYLWYSSSIIPSFDRIFLSASVITSELSVAIRPLCSASIAANGIARWRSAAYEVPCFFALPIDRFATERASRWVTHGSLPWGPQLLIHARNPWAVPGLATTLGV